MSKKTPAFQFYPADFLMGTSDFSQCEVGAYLLLLLHQWGHGSLPSSPAKLRIIARGKVTELIMSKFEKLSDGTLQNLRMENERKKQLAWTEKQRKNGALGGRPKNPTVNPNPNPTVNPNPNPKKAYQSSDLMSTPYVPLETEQTQNGDDCVCVKDEPEGKPLSLQPQIPWMKKVPKVNADFWKHITKELSRAFVTGPSQKNLKLMSDKCVKLPRPPGSVSPHDWVSQLKEAVTAGIDCALRDRQPNFAVARIDAQWAFLVDRYNDSS